MNEIIDVKLISVFDECLFYIKGEYMFSVNQCISQIFQTIEKSKLVRKQDSYIIYNLISKKKPTITWELEEYITKQFEYIRRNQIKWLKKQSFLKKRKYVNNISKYRLNIKKQIEKSLVQRPNDICKKLDKMFNDIYREIERKMLSNDRVISDKFNLEVFKIILAIL